MAIIVFTNCGNLDYKQSDTMDWFSLKVFYNPDSIAKILALVDVTIQFRFTMDTNKEPSMFVHTGPYSVLNFYQCRKVFYYFDTSAPNVLNRSINIYYFLSTIQEIIFFYRAKIEGADTARILICTIGFSSSTKFKIIVKGN